jgi:hypothetical protein
MPSADRAKASNATDPGKPAGSHFIKTKNRDSMPTADRARKAGKVSLGKPKSGSTECYVLEEVNPVDKRLYQRKGLGLQIPKQKLQLSWSSSASCPHLSLALCLHDLVDQGGE